MVLALLRTQRHRSGRLHYVFTLLCDHGFLCPPNNPVSNCHRYAELQLDEGFKTSIQSYNARDGAFGHLYAVLDFDGSGGLRL